jgi:uncharacterized membrane protein YgaE (UPF0421/DUF939 family)
MTFWEGRRFARLRLHTPDAVEVADWAQHGKTALAGVIAWVVATDVLGLEQPFLAPWAAVLVVHATVYRTVSRGGQQIAATFLGVFLAWASGSLFGVGPLGMGVMLAAAFLLGRHHWLEEESMTVATTGIVVLATNAIGQSHLLAGRLLDTSIGVVVGLAVNLVVWPPLRDRAARAFAHELPRRLADTLEQMAAGLDKNLDPADVEEWMRRCREVDLDIDHAWVLLRQARESSRLNPRRSQPTDIDDLGRMLHLLEEAVAEAISLARTVATSAKDANEWDDSFRTQVRELLARSGSAIGEGDDTALAEVRDELGRLVRDHTSDVLARSHWHEYGGVVVSLRNIVDAGIELAPWTRRAGSSLQRRARYDLPGPVRRRPHLTVGRRG